MDVKSEIIFSKIGECCVYKNKKKIINNIFPSPIFSSWMEKYKKRKINNQMVYKNGSIFLRSYKTCCLLILFSKTNTNDFVTPAIHQAIGGCERERMKK